MVKFTKKAAGMGCVIALTLSAVFAQQFTTSPGTESANSLAGNAEGTTINPRTFYQETALEAATNTSQQGENDMSGLKINTPSAEAEGVLTGQATPSHLECWLECREQ